MKKMMAMVGMAAALVTMGGCATLDKVYDAEVTWTNAPVVKVVTNTVVVTNVVPQVVERQSVVLVTNDDDRRGVGLRDARAGGDELRDAAGDEHDSGV